MMDYFKIEYKTASHKQKHDWITIDEKIDSSKREYILTDLSPNEYYRFRLGCFYKNGFQQHSLQTARFRLVEQAKILNNDNKNGSTTATAAAVASQLDLIELQILQVWALSDSSLALKWQLFNDFDNNSSAFRQLIEGFHIYYRKLTPQDIANFDKLAGNTDIPLENYQLIKIPNSQLHLVDTYIITNLD